MYLNARGNRSAMSVSQDWVCFRPAESFLELWLYAALRFSPVMNKLHLKMRKSRKAQIWPCSHLLREVCSDARHISHSSMSSWVAIIINLQAYNWQYDCVRRWCCWKTCLSQLDLKMLGRGLAWHSLISQSRRYTNIFLDPQQKSAKGQITNNTTLKP